MTYEYEKIKNDYLIINEEDDDEMITLKGCLNRLTLPERKIFIAYVHLGKYSEVAKIYNVSAPTAKTYIKKVQNKIITMMENVERPYLD